ncbi:MAG: hypothetical protein WC763_05370 [Candidatus Paceibacterota bacterium]|jgi:hypothetical protein
MAAATSAAAGQQQQQPPAVQAQSGGGGGGGGFTGRIISAYETAKHAIGNAPTAARIGVGIAGAVLPGILASWITGAYLGTGYGAVAKVVGAHSIALWMINWFKARAAGTTQQLAETLLQRSVTDPAFDPKTMEEFERLQAALYDVERRLMVENDKLKVAESNQDKRFTETQFKKILALVAEAESIRVAMLKDEGVSRMGIVEDDTVVKRVVGTAALEAAGGNVEHANRLLPRSFRAPSPAGGVAAAAAPPTRVAATAAQQQKQQSPALPLNHRIPPGGMMPVLARGGAPAAVAPAAAAAAAAMQRPRPRPQALLPQPSKSKQQQLQRQQQRKAPTPTRRSSPQRATASRTATATARGRGKGQTAATTTTPSRGGSGRRPPAVIKTRRNAPTRSTRKPAAIPLNFSGSGRRR